jgi:hypothetical protein
MLFKRCLFIIATACITFTVAAPVPDIADEDFTIARREPSDDFDIDLVARKLDLHQVAHRANAVLKAQAKKPVAAQKKAQANKKVTDKISKPKTAGFSKMNTQQRAAANAHNTKAHNKAKGQAVTHAQKQAKVDRTKKWADHKKTTYTKAPKAVPKAPKVSKATKTEHRGQVKAALHGAADKMRNTHAIPGRHDHFAVGGNKYSGKDTRKAVMNSHLNEKIPVGRGDNKLPKPFRNDPYSPTHGNKALQGKQPIPGGHSNLKEYPVTSHGWTGSGAVGPARVITSHAGGNDHFHGVIGHDLKAGGNHEDHYLATHHKAKREVDDFELAF